MGSCILSGSSVGELDGLLRAVPYLTPCRQASAAATAAAAAPAPAVLLRQSANLRCKPTGLNPLLVALTTVWCSLDSYGSCPSYGPSPMMCSKIAVYRHPTRQGHVMQ